MPILLVGGEGWYSEVLERVAMIVSLAEWCVSQTRAAYRESTEAGIPSIVPA
jgi:hypothetical protein